jgi:hypothetical protein
MPKRMTSYVLASAFVSKVAATFSASTSESMLVALGQPWSPVRLALTARRGAVVQVAAIVEAHNNSPAWWTFRLAARPVLHQQRLSGLGNPCGQVYRKAESRQGSGHAAMSAVPDDFERAGWSVLACDL